MAVNFADKAKVESHPAKLISDDSTAEAEDIDINSMNQIWNMFSVFIYLFIFLI